MIGLFLSILVGSIAIFPFVVSLILVVFHRSVGRKMTMKKIADITTAFLFLSVYMIAHSLFGDGVGYVLSIVSIVIVLVFAILERRRVKDFHIIHLLRKVWRLFFILLMIAYFSLIIIGLVLTIYTQLA